MKNTIHLILGLLIFSFHCLSQSVDNNNKTQVKTGDPLLNWDRFENHPARSILDTIPIFSDYDDVVFKPEANDEILEINGKYLKNNPVDYLLKHPRFSKYKSGYTNANNEFEKKRIEKQILEERNRISSSILDKKVVTAGLLMKLSEYSFEKKGFFLNKSPLEPRGTFKEYMTSLGVDINYNWTSGLDFIAVNEKDAEQLIKNNPKREVVVQGIIEITVEQFIEKKLEFVIVSAFQDNPYVIHVVPKISDIWISMGKLANEKSTGIEGILEKNPAISKSTENKYYESLNNSIWGFLEVYNQSLKYGFDPFFNEDIKKIIEQDKQKQAKAKVILNQFFKIGKIYNGYQLLPDETKKSITIIFNNEVYDSTWEGTCQFSNGKKCRVYAIQSYNNNDLYNPTIGIYFYQDISDELGPHESCPVFYLKDNQLIGYAMNEKFDHNLNSKTVINLK